MALDQPESSSREVWWIYIYNASNNASITLSTPTLLICLISSYMSFLISLRFRLFGIIKQTWHPSMVSTVNLLLRYCTAQVIIVSFNLSRIAINLTHSLMIIWLPMVEIQYDDTYVLIDVIKISSLSIKTNCHRLLVPGVRGGGGCLV